MNPNNCSTCEHKKLPQGGHCYMFRDEPNEVCMQHSLRQRNAIVAMPGNALAAGLFVSQLLKMPESEGSRSDNE